MKAVILAAGRGSRLGKITERKPKSLVEVNGKSILEYQLEALLKNGIKDITLCVGYMGEQIEKYCRENFPMVKFSREEAPINNMLSLYNAKESLDDDVFIMNGDVVFDSDVISKMVASPGSVIAVEKAIHNDESMKVVTNDSGNIIDISKKVHQDSSYGCSIDVYKFTKEDAQTIVNEMKRMVEVEKINDVWTEVMLQRLFEAQRILARPVDINGYKWFEIDDFDDLHKAELIFNDKINQLRQKTRFLLDRDGTLLLGDQPLEGSAEFLDFLKDSEKVFHILSNNSSKTKDQHLQIFLNAGLKMNKDDIYISTDSLIEHLIRNNIRKIFLVANKMVSEYFVEQGFIIDSESPEALILTYDTELDYDKLRQLSSLLRKDIPYFATHIDLVCPTPNGPIPDIGSFIKLIEITTGKTPLRTFGKPTKELVNSFSNNHELALVGDRLYTDILLAKNAGILSVLVLSGETKREDVEFSDIKPDIIVKNIKELLNLIS